MTISQQLFLKNLKRIRKIKGISQLELADRMDILQTTLSRIENGKTDPGIRTIEKISKGLEVPISELFIDVDSDNNSLKEKLTKLQSLNEYDQKLLEAIIENFIEKHRLEEQLQIKMNKRLDELKKVRNQ